MNYLGYFFLKHFAFYFFNIKSLIKINYFKLFKNNTYVEKEKWKIFFLDANFYVTKPKQYVKDKDDIMIEDKIVIYIKLRVKIG